MMALGQKCMNGAVTAKRALKILRWWDRYVSPIEIPRLSHCWRRVHGSTAKTVHRRVTITGTLMIQD